jgi:hypothetical protein
MVWGGDGGPGVLVPMLWDAAATLLIYYEGASPSPPPPPSICQLLKGQGPYLPTTYCIYRPSRYHTCNFKQYKKGREFIKRAKVYRRFIRRAGFQGRLYKGLGFMRGPKQRTGFQEGT